MRTDIGRCLVLAAAGCMAPALHAQSGPWSFGGGITVGTDDNVFRAAHGQEVSDRYTAWSVFSALDQTLSRQQLRGRAGLRQESYGARSDLDNTAYGLSAEWLGSSAGGISWKLGLTSDRNLASYATVLEPERRVPNSETTRQLLAGVQVGAAAQWIAGATYSRRSIDYSSAAYLSDEYRIDSVGANLQWSPAGPLSVSLGPRWSEGLVPFARIRADGSVVEDRFERRDVDLTIDWRATGASTLTGRLSLTRQRHDQLSQRDFSGTTGQLSWRWLVTGRTTVDLALSRDTGSETSFLAVAFLGAPLRGTGDSSQLTSRASGRLSYQIGGKTSLSLAGQYADRQLSSRTTVADGVVEIASASGHDRSGSLTLGLSWAATRSTDLDCAVTHARRAGMAPLATSYRSDTANCSVRLTVR